MKEYTVEVYEDGSKLWYLNGKRHREDGPAIEFSTGRKDWYLDGQLHREDGPAIERPDGRKYWYLDDELHREDGPAIEYADGRKYWYLRGNHLTEEEHKRRTAGITMGDALEEADRLRAKKKQIYEELQDAVEGE